MKILNVVGCRPNFIKMAALMAEMKNHAEIQPLLVHTGQHYDDVMSDVFFRDLDIPKPDFCLHVGSASFSRQLAQIMQSFEAVLSDVQPDLVLVVGDVNSTIACSLSAVTLGYPVAHVEAGLRSFDRQMPEEINRVLTDSIADFLFASEQSGVKNLLREGRKKKQVFFVGNVMIDTLVMNSDRIASSRILERLALCPKSYALITLHRPSNVDNLAALERITSALEELQRYIHLIFPVHPRTEARLAQFGMLERLSSLSNLQLVEPLGYIDLIRLMKDSLFLMTDSGGMQEESTALKIPCLTLRDNTERPVTVTQGTNQLVGTDPSKIIMKGLEIFTGLTPYGRIPAKWDGQASKRIVSILLRSRHSSKQLYGAVKERSLCLDTLSRV